MKPQQRKFVVEIKYSRRRSRVQSKSIWGEHDLKAMAREAEADIPHLVEGNEVSNRAIVRAAEMVERSHLPGLAGDSGSAILPDAAEPSSTAVVVIQPVASHPIQYSAGPKVERKTRQSRKPPAARRSVDPRPGPIMRSVPVEISREELVALEDENRFLEDRLIAQLREQNSQLRHMLQRFE